MDRLESPEIASHMSSNDFQQQVQDNGEGDSLFNKRWWNNQWIMWEKFQLLPHTRQKISQTDHRLKPKSYHFKKKWVENVHDHTTGKDFIDHKKD